jgi:hypothetical protein
MKVIIKMRIKMMKKIQEKVVLQDQIPPVHLDLAVNEKI